jgi:hypothetical protein
MLLVQNKASDDHQTDAEFMCMHSSNPRVSTGENIYISDCREKLHKNTLKMTHHFEISPGQTKTNVTRMNDCHGHHLAIVNHKVSDLHLHREWQ